MPQEENSVGPSLGADSIREGFQAGIAGLAAVIIVMLVYYRRSGTVNAVLALLLNTIILLAAVVSYTHAVLTLPGIAGVILTVGMAVDSNVLIFEHASVRSCAAASLWWWLRWKTALTRLGGPSSIRT